jgi:transcriptional regulator with GAF, ATPase, and Fis domain
VKTLESTLGDTSDAGRSRPRWTARVVALAGRIVHRPPIELPLGRLEVGRAAGSGGLTLDDPRVSRLHATLTLEPGRGTVRRQGRSLFVDGISCDQAPLSDGSVLVLGATAVVLRHRPDEGEPVPPAWGLLGDSPGARALRRTIRLVGPTDSTVLVLGESGTGKELVARALHEASGRKGPLVAVNTSAIPPSLAEAHLFGHVAGAYTGATTAGTGVFRAADGGTLFLDEMADLLPELQPKLLRVLEDRMVVPVGATKGTRVDVRVVCATNKDVLAEVDAGRFRGDLYARISDFTIELPPLRDRREDILTLLERDVGQDAPPLAPDLLVALLCRPWRFNVRELKKTGTQLKVRGAGKERLTLDMIDAPTPATPSIPPSALAAAPTPEEPLPTRAPSPVPTRAELEALLVRHEGVLENVAKETGRSRRQIHRWLDKHGLDVDRYRKR